jgi:hypothetical protein
MAGYWFAGLWTKAVTQYFLLSLPVVLLATFLGRAINRKMQAHQFLLYIHAGLIATGTLLLIQAL